MSLTTAIVLALEMEGNSSSSVGSFVITDTNTSYLETYGRKSKGVNFTGSNSWIKIDNNPGFNMGAGDFGISCWVKRNVINQRQTFLAKSNLNGNNSSLSFWFEWTAANQLLNYFVDVNHSFTVLTSSAVANTLYHHVALVRRGSTLYQYVDGVVTSSASVAGKTMNSTSHKVGIGVYGEGTSISLNGSMDEVYFWKGYGPTDAEVLQLATNVYYPFTGPSDTLSAGLISYYKLDGNSTDSIGRYNGVDTAITYGTGIVNQGAVFNGSTSKILIGKPFNLTAGTFSLWVKPSNRNVNNRYLSDSGGYCYIETNGTQAAYGIYDSANNGSLLYTSIGINVWTHFVCLWNGTQIKFYKNGILVGSSSRQSINSGINAYDVHIGSGNFTGGYMTGSIDEVGIWNRALTDDEALKLYNYTSGLSYPLITQPLTLQTSLKAYYKLDGNSFDSVNSNNGVDTNITYTTGKISQAAQFINGSKIIANPIDIGGFSELTVSCWFYKNTSVQSALATQYLPQAGGHQWGLVSNANGSIRAIISTNGIADPLADTVNTFSNNMWHHAAFVFNGNLTGDSQRLKIYVDGVLQTSTFSAAIGETISVTNVNLWITSLLSNESSFYLNGLLDELGIWRRALSNNEILQLYNNSSGLSYPLIVQPPNLATDTGFLIFFYKN